MTQRPTRALASKPSRTPAGLRALTRVVNVVDKVIEVYTQPGGTGEVAAYAQCDVFAVGTSVPVVLDGTTVGTVPVSGVMG